MLTERAWQRLCSGGHVPILAGGVAIWQCERHDCHMATQPMSKKAAVVVRKTLDEQNRTQEWLSAESGIPMRTLARRLHKHNPSGMSLDELGAIATALGTDLVTLLIAARDAKSVLAVAS